MRRIVLVGGNFALAAVLIVAFLPTLMRVRSPEEVVPILARQELQAFHLYFEVFESRHGKAPASVEELMADGKYLSGVVEPHRTRILRRLEYPLAPPPVSASRSPAVAAYHVAGFGDFFLLLDGTALEKRLPDYTVALYRQAQRQESEAIKGQPVQRMAAGGHWSGFGLLGASAIAHFSRWAEYD